MEWVNPGVRDILLLVVVLAAVYLVFTVAKLVQVGRRRPEAAPHFAAPSLGMSADNEDQPVEPTVTAAPASTTTSRTALAAYTDAMEEADRQPPPRPFAVPPTPTFDWDDVKELFGETPAVLPSAPVVPIPPAAETRGFGESLSEHLARTDMETELQRMRAEMARMRQEVEELRRAQHVSPHYAEAMELAQRGLSAQDVAARLDMSLAEAELVQALSRSPAHFDEGETDGVEGSAAGSRRRAG